MGEPSILVNDAGMISSEQAEDFRYQGGTGRCRSTWRASSNFASLRTGQCMPCDFHRGKEG
jgi:hypothetical protein